MGGLHKVAVLGAAGYTGRFAVELLTTAGIEPIAVTRSGRFRPLGFDADIACRTIDFAVPASLDEALAGADAVINCAGPFFDTAEPAARAALRAHIPYLDVTAEQQTVQRLFERLDAPARAARVTLFPAMAFYGGLADLLVTALVGGQGRAEAIDIAVGLDSWHPTRGTRLTGEQNVYPRMIVREGALVRVPTPPPSRDWDFPAPLGSQPMTCVALSEVILIARHIEAGAITSYMNLKPLEDLADQATPPPSARDASGRSAQQFVMDVRVTTGGQVRRATASGRDIYAASALLVVNACATLLSKVPETGGVHAPGALFDARQLLATLAPDVTVRFEG